MISLVKEMSQDWLGRVMLACLGVIVGLFGLLCWVIWSGMHDGVKCAEQRFSHFQPVPVIVGKITTVHQIPIYECLRYVEAPEELQGKVVGTVVDH